VQQYLVLRTGASTVVGHSFQLLLQMAFAEGQAPKVLWDELTGKGAGLVTFRFDNRGEIGFGFGLRCFSFGLCTFDAQLGFAAHDGYVEQQSGEAKLPFIQSRPCLASLQIP
jgi:hypothetical protein